MVSCNQDDELDCPKIWSFDREQVSANARVDSGMLIMTVWNPATPNAIQLSQTPLIADFDVSITMDEMTWDTLISPQFRFEVFRASDPNTNMSGISVNPDAFYCYVGSTNPENRDMRVMHNPAGTMRITRRADTLKCTASLDGVTMSYEDVLHSEDMALRLVFGSTNSNQGNTSVNLRDFEGFHNLLSSVVEEKGVQSDDFSCQSW